MTSKRDTEGYVQTKKKIEDNINHWKNAERNQTLSSEEKTTVVLYSLETTIQARRKLGGISRRLEKTKIIYLLQLHFKVKEIIRFFFPDTLNSIGHAMQLLWVVFWRKEMI